MNNRVFEEHVVLDDSKECAEKNPEVPERMFTDLGVE